MQINELGQDTVFEMVDELRARNGFTRPEYYSRLKNQIKELSSLPVLTEESELVEELTKNVKMVKENYR